ncbi:hypothetical protein GCM10009743_42100 [Kribbella swartbergensis]
MADPERSRPAEVRAALRSTDEQIGFTLSDVADGNEIMPVSSQILIYAYDHGCPGRLADESNCKRGCRDEYPDPSLICKDEQSRWRHRGQGTDPRPPGDDR